jgi:hypothetical protein
MSPWYDEPLPVDNADLARNWRRDRQKDFEEAQRRLRDWVCFREIAEWRAELHARDGIPNETVRAATFDMLRDDLLAGDFDARSRTQVRYLNYATPKARMTRPWLTSAIETFPADTVVSAYLAPCWIPRRMFDRWLVKHELPPSPPRFAPAEVPEPAPEVEPPTPSLPPRFAPGDRSHARVAEMEEEAVRVAAEHLRGDNEPSKVWLFNLMTAAGIPVSWDGSRYRVWPKARKLAGKGELAKAGRKPLPGRKSGRKSRR